MGKFDKYLNRARDIAEDTSDMAKNIAGDAMSGAREKAQGVMKDARAGKEIRQGITQLEAMPEIEDSIIYKMEHEAAINDLSSLLLFINDGRLDNDSVIEEIRKVMKKVQLASEPQEEETEEQKAIEKVKTIAYNACTGALETLGASADEA